MRGSSHHCHGGALCTSCRWGRGIPHAAAAVLNPGITTTLPLPSALCSCAPPPTLTATGSHPASVPRMVTDGSLSIIVSVNEGVGRAHAAR